MACNGSLSGLFASASKKKMLLRSGKVATLVSVCSTYVLTTAKVSQTFCKSMAPARFRANTSPLTNHLSPSTWPFSIASSVRSSISSMGSPVGCVATPMIGDGRPAVTVTAMAVVVGRPLAAEAA